MVRNRENKIQKALELVENGMNPNKAANTHKIPISTLRNRIKNKGRDHSRTWIPLSTERLIVAQIQELSSLGHTLTILSLKLIVSKFLNKL